MLCARAYVSINKRYMSTKLFLISGWLLEIYILITVKIISEWVPTGCSRGDFIVLTHWETKLMAP